MLLTVADASQLKLINKATTINDPDTLAVIYDNLGSEEILTPEGDRFTLASRYTKAEFTSIKSTVKETDFRAKTVVMAKSDGSGLITVETRYKIRIVTYDGSVFWYRVRETEKDTAIGETVTVDGKDVSLKAIFDGTASYDGIPAFSEKTNSVYTNFVVPSRQAYIGKITKSNPGNLIWFMIILMVVLVAMSTFRSPAVSAWLPVCTILSSATRAVAPPRSLASLLLPVPPSGSMQSTSPCI